MLCNTGHCAVIATIHGCAHVHAHVRTHAKDACTAGTVIITHGGFSKPPTKTW